MTLRTVRIQIIEPKEATNLVINPSFEAGTTGYTAVGAGDAIAQSSTYSRRGAYSLAVTPATGAVAGVYYASIAFTSGTTYAFSADVLDVAGQGFNMFISSTTAAAGICSTATEWTGTGYWKRRSVTYSSTATASFYLFITRDSVASTSAFYVDGVQCESGAESTYLDGDMTGFVTGQTAYRWNGTRHASTSWRSAQTRSGGTYLDISSYARLLAIAGLGMASLSNIAIPSTLGGSYYQNTVSNERAFSLVLNFAGAGDYAVTEGYKKEIIDAIKPDATIYRQPLLLQVDQLDANALECAETLMIPCVYESGLEMDGSGDNYTERVALTFRQFMPLIQQQGEKGVVLGYSTAVADADYVVYQGSDGVWHNINTTFDDTVHAIVQDTTGKIYLGGAFTSTDGNYITTWNGTTLTPFSTSDEPNGAIIALALGPDNKLYAGGGFTAIAGTSDSDHIAVWNGSAWAALGNGLNGDVYAIAVGNNGYVYAAGDFTAAAGTSDSDKIAVWNGSAWAAMGNGFNLVALALAVDKAGNVYAGGQFATTGGTTVNGIAKWNGTAWSALGTGVSGGLADVYSLCLDDAGNLYITGSFTSVNGVDANYIAKWNGYEWSPLGSGLNALGSELFYVDSKLYVGGIFTTAGGIATTDRTAIWTGSTWVPLDIDIPGTATAKAILISNEESLFIGYDTAGTGYSSTVTASNVGSAAVYPKVVMTGPGTVSQLKNYTTGKAIYFDLALLAGEVATLNLDPLNISFTSSFRGNIMSTILPGSDLNWELQPGANNVSSFIYSGSTSDSGVVMVWSDQYWSIDGAIR